MVLKLILKLVLERSPIVYLRAYYLYKKNKNTTVNLHKLLKLIKFTCRILLEFI